MNKERLPEYEAAMEAFLSGDHHRAEESITAAVKKMPDDSRLLHLLGNIKYTIGRLGEASAAYEKVIALAPSSCEAYYKLGVCYVRMGNLHKALTAFHKNIEGKCHGHVMSYYWMGLINSFLGNDDAARQAFTLLHEESSESKLANFFLAQLHLRRNETADAMRLLKELLEVSPDFAEAHFLLGQAYSQVHDTPNAIGCYRRTMELNPSDNRARMEYERLVDVPSI
jgi:protein O-GlcNAc transferase